MEKKETMDDYQIRWDFFSPRAYCRWRSWPGKSISHIPDDEIAGVGSGVRLDSGPD